ncbi:DUF397 domain-containing protein [Streptomyces sp. NPDC127033]|uniref:DUF397 domain-containing protein n=1 Tax=Streptomyces sp. NPDC127033 TaxID=3347110 RepID=UPI003662F560
MDLIDFNGVQWRRSSYSGGDNNCVELAVFGGRVAIRDSKCPERTPVVIARPDAQAFLAGVQAGRWSIDHRGPAPSRV